MQVEMEVMHLILLNLIFCFNIYFTKVCLKILFMNFKQWQS